MVVGSRVAVLKKNIFALEIGAEPVFERIKCVRIQRAIDFAPCDFVFAGRFAGREIHHWASGRWIGRCPRPAVSDDITLLHIGEWPLHTEPTWANPKKRSRDCPDLDVSDFQTGNQVWLQFASSVNSPTNKQYE